jgi:hypothetical protein
MPKDDKGSGGAFADVVNNVSGVFRHMLPGFLVVGGAYISHPKKWFAGFNPEVTGHLILLGVATIVIGNTLFVFNRYIVEQFIEYFFFIRRNVGPAARSRRDRLYRVVGAFTYRSLHNTDAPQRAIDHIHFRASSILLLLTLSEVLLVFSIRPEEDSHFARYGSWPVLFGVVVLFGALYQTAILRRIDYYTTFPNEVPKEYR